jgi:hypothetical protein
MIGAHISSSKTKRFRLAQGITVHVDRSLREGSLVTVARLGGRSMNMEYPLGEPDNPFGLAQDEGKVLSMLQMAYGIEQSTIILSSFYNLANQLHMGKYISTLSGSNDKICFPIF